MRRLKISTRIVCLFSLAMSALLAGQASAVSLNQVSGTMTNLAVTIPTGPFDPASYGVPDSIAGYKVLAVISANNTACVGPDDKRLVLLTDEPTVMDTVNKSQIDAVNVEAARLGLTDYTKGGIQWAGGPSATTQQFAANLPKWNQTAVMESDRCAIWLYSTGPTTKPTTNGY